MIDELQATLKQQNELISDIATLLQDYAAIQEQIINDLLSDMQAVTP